MAHPAVALALLQGALQQPIFETPQPAAGMLGGEGCEAQPAATAVVDPDTGMVNPDPHHCLGHVCGRITVPIAKLQPRLQIYIHLNLTDGTADIEGVGTMAIATLKEMLDGKQVKATPVIDLNHMPAEHQYRPSSKLREAAQLVFPKEAFPFSNRSSRSCDLDHTEAFQKSSRDAQTRIGNLGPFSRRPHRGKTAGF